MAPLLPPRRGHGGGGGVPSSMPSSCWSIRGISCRFRRHSIARRSPATSASPTRLWRARGSSTARSSAPQPSGCCARRCLNPGVRRALRQPGDERCDGLRDLASVPGVCPCASGAQSRHAGAGCALVRHRRYLPEAHPAPVSGLDVSQRSLWRGYARDVQPVRGAGGRQGVRRADRPEGARTWAATATRDSCRRTRDTTPRGRRCICTRRIRACRRAHTPAIQRVGATRRWRRCSDDLALLPAATRKVLLFVPYNRRLISPPGSPVAAVWDECKRRAPSMAQAMPNSCRGGLPAAEPHHGHRHQLLGRAALPCRGGRLARA